MRTRRPPAPPSFAELLDTAVPWPLLNRAGVRSGLAAAERERAAPAVSLGEILELLDAEELG